MLKNHKVIFFLLLDVLCVPMVQRIRSHENGIGIVLVQQHSTDVHHYHHVAGSTSGTAESYFFRFLTLERNDTDQRYANVFRSAHTLRRINYHDRQPTMVKQFISAASQLTQSFKSTFRKLIKSFGAMSVQPPECVRASRLRQSASSPRSCGRKHGELRDFYRWWRGES